ncbi:hypothetical protein AWB78_07332 [Caballeronia calidae]|uniref:Uncharacterized protein n=2 Tax=Caballeronia calidae TaxID=1777139 RepID=A0A158EE48_9BURK|nr:hypothetical protein AWB78_07332 [Caballeronia calidae]
MHIRELKKRVLAKVKLWLIQPLSDERSLSQNQKNMKFSEYTVTGKQDQSVDPLGFTQPFGALRSRFYPQFTVLSNSPVYHGVLALIYQVLSRQKITPAHGEFAQRFREAECVWGLANVAAEQSVLNVTKYQSILGGHGRTSRREVGRLNAIFRSLAYGTLGHYSNPSANWGFLDRKGMALTTLGTRLADVFAVRDGLSLREAIERWLSGDALDRDELKALGKAFGIDGAASSDERTIWQAAVAARCEKEPSAATLWQTPPDGALLKKGSDDAYEYKTLFDHLASRHTRLADSFRQAGRFEAMSAVCLFLFEREYLLCHDAGSELPAAGTLEQTLAAALAETARAYMSQDGHRDTRGLFAELAGADGHAAASAIITRHHVTHQKGKGALPYFEHGELRVRERFERRRFTALHEELNTLDSGDDQIAVLTHRYRRDWHFERAQGYARYIGVVA